jgi:hypothetical protein
MSSPIWGSWPDIYYCLTVTVLFFVGRPLWREDGSVCCICCWSLPAQSFSGPSTFVFGTIFYCLRFETSLFVASYDSQGHGGGIRPHLRMGTLYSFCTDHTENSLNCCKEVFTATLHSSGRGADRIENAVLLLFPCVYSVARCLTFSYLATLWPSTLHYNY